MEEIKKCDRCHKEFSQEGKWYRPSGKTEFVPICSDLCFTLICHDALFSFRRRGSNDEKLNIAKQRT